MIECDPELSTKCPELKPLVEAFCHFIGYPSGTKEWKEAKRAAEDLAETFPVASIRRATAIANQINRALKRGPWAATETGLPAARP